MAPTAIRILWIVLITVFFSQAAPAYPISPRPLRQLVLESEYIIVGYVVRTADGKGGESGRTARIAVLEQLQGHIPEDTIEITFRPFMVCPASDLYYDTTFVLSFIYKYEGVYRTHALSYGAKTLSKDEIELYKTRIAEIQEILKIKQDDERQQATIEWLIKCAEQPATRWEGVYELSPESHFMSYYARKQQPDYKSFLTPPQRERLKTALLQTEQFDYHDFGLIDLVYAGNEMEIDRLLIRELRSLPEDSYWIAEDFMVRLKHRNSSEKTTALIAEYNQLRFQADNKDRIKKLIDEFLALVGS